MGGDTFIRNGWRDLAVWAVLTLLVGAWAWTRYDFDESRQRVTRIEQAREERGKLIAADHDDIVRLKEVVPRIERELLEIKRQNEEILRRLGAR